MREPFPWRRDFHSGSSGAQCALASDQGTHLPVLDGGQAEVRRGTGRVCDVERNPPGMPPKYQAAQPFTQKSEKLKIKIKNHFWLLVLFPETKPLKIVLTVSHRAERW